jgi:probable HAF family extracellular repeat protein
MSLCKTLGLAIFASVCLLGETTGSTLAQCAPGFPCATEWSQGKSIDLGTVPGDNASVAHGNNNAGQVVGFSEKFGDLLVATEWSHGKVIDLGVLPGSAESQANGINDRRTVVGVSEGNSFSRPVATEWRHGSVIDLGILPTPGFNSSTASAINNAGQVVGQSSCMSILCSGPIGLATEWSHGKIINLGGLAPPSQVDFLQSSVANGINDIGQVVGSSTIGVLNVGFTEVATEWSDGKVINLGGLPGSADSVAQSINDAGQVVGASTVGGTSIATEWSHGSVIDLGGLPGSTFSIAYGINDRGQVVGYSVVGGVWVATEWSGDSVINLGPGEALGINNAGQAVGDSDFTPLPITVPESSTWAMMLIGFASLSWAGYRRAKAGHATIAR